MNKEHDDGLEWLRKVRRNIAAKCGNDIHAINEYYRTAAAGVPHGRDRDDALPKQVKRKIHAHG
jgi:hypothetical protein